MERRMVGGREERWWRKGEEERVEGGEGIIKTCSGVNVHT